MHPEDQSEVIAAIGPYGPYIKHGKIYANMKDKKGTIVCDDYQDASYITDVKKAIDDYVKKEGLSLRIIEGKFAVIDI